MTVAQRTLASPAHEAADFVASFERRWPHVVEDAMVRQQTGVPELTALAEVDVVDAVAQAISVTVELCAVAMRASDAAPRGAPEAVLHLTQTAARNEVPLSSVLRLLRTIHAAVLDHALAHGEVVGARLEVLATASARLFSYMEQLVPDVWSAFHDEQQRVGAGSERLRTAKVRAILAGDEDVDIDYPLDGPHVALVLRGPQARVYLRAVLAEVAAPMLVTEAPDRTVWAWAACGLCADEVVDVLRRSWSGGCSIGVSASESGLAGFRATHRKARLALRLGRRRGRPVTTFDDVALEALAFGGEDEARDFVRSEMAPLLGDGRRLAVARQTLTAYFATGSAANAGRRLGISERAVVYRLRHAEELLGRPLTERRAELETALRLHGMFEAPRHRAAS